MKEIFAFQDSKLKPIVITYDPAGQFISSSNNNDDDEEVDATEKEFQHENVHIQEPAYNFRLWSSSILLSKLLEQICLSKLSSTKPNVLLELGAGLGLPSLTATRLGIQHVITTDLPIALPMLYHNIQQNISIIKTNDNNVAYINNNQSFKSHLKCPIGHSLTDVISDSDEYMCSVCEGDIEEESGISRCLQCNFDVCHDTCLKHIENNELAELPLWFTVQLQYQQAISNSSTNSISSSSDSKINSTNKDICVSLHYESSSSLLHNTINLMPCDWNSQSHLNNITQQIQRCYNSNNSSNGVDDKNHNTTESNCLYIVGADVTYNEHSVETLFVFLYQLVNKLFTIDDSTNNGLIKAIRLLLVHQVRSLPTTQSLLTAILEFTTSHPSSNSSENGGSATQLTITTVATMELLEISQDNDNSNNNSSTKASKPCQSQSLSLLDSHTRNDMSSSSLVENGVYLFDVIVVVNNQTTASIA